MEHHPGWFDLLLSIFQHNLDGVARYAGFPVNEEGRSWVGGEAVQYQHVVGALLVLVLLLVVGVKARRRLSDVEAAIVPDDTLTVRTFVELLVGATYGQMADMMGKKAARYFLPLIGTCAFFILFSNALSLVPGFVPPTDKLNTTLAAASVIFLATHIYGVKEHGLAYFKHFLGPILWLAPLMVLIEIVSHLVRPLSLSIRLMANMTADHMVLAVFLGLVPFVVPVPMYLLGTIVVVVQTLVFCLLSTVYISMAIAHEEH